MRANEHLLWYFASKDMGVAHALAGGFFWSENIVWKEDLRVKGRNGKEGRNVTVVLSGRDLIVDTEAVKRYLTASSSGDLLADVKAVWMINENRNATSITTISEDTQAWKGWPWKGSGLEVLYYDHLDHGQVFDLKKTSEATELGGGFIMVVATTIARFYCSVAVEMLHIKILQLVGSTLNELQPSAPRHLIPTPCIGFGIANNKGPVQK